MAPCVTDSTTKEEQIEYHDNDVLCGRGGSINSHPGNERFRKLVERRKRVYLTARFKREKRLIASSIVSEIHKLKPPGRFLTRDSKTGQWINIGDEKARDKTSQALRENAPTIRAEIETEIHHQRAEMQREEDAAAAQAPPMHVPNHPIPPNMPPPYYHQWGYYGPFYGGYGPPQDAQQPQFPPPQQGAPPAYPGQPVPWPQGGGPYAQATSPQNAPTPPPITQPPHTHSRHYPKPSKAKQPPALHTAASEDSKGSAFSTIPSSISAWTKNSFSFGNNSMDQQDDAASTTSSRRVSFQDHQGRQKRPNHGPSPKQHVTPEQRQPSDLAAAGYHGETSADSSSLLSQVAHHILGSWDPACASGTQEYHPNRPSLEDPQEVSMDIGQEVELVEPEEDIMDYDMDDDVAESRNMPPPANELEVDWPSRIGSCHTWLPEAPSFFSTTNNPLAPSASLEMDQHPVPHAPSLEMDQSQAGYSLGGESVGGGSLCHVFQQDAIEGAPAPSQNHSSQGLLASPRHDMNHRVLTQIPSWERSFRSHSPSTIASESESVVSKRSEPPIPRVLSPRTLSPRNSMEWDQPRQIRE